jgi:hypothetical protein
MSNTVRHVFGALMCGQGMEKGNTKKLLVQSNLGLRRRVFVSLFYCLKTLIICILTPIPTPPHPTPPTGRRGTVHR